MVKWLKKMMKGSRGKKAQYLLPRYPLSEESAQWEKMSKEVRQAYLDAKRGNLYRVEIGAHSYWEHTDDMVILVECFVGTGKYTELKFWRLLDNRFVKYTAFHYDPGTGYNFLLLAEPDIDARY
jgi:hypothetical protein